MLDKPTLLTGVVKEFIEMYEVLQHGISGMQIFFLLMPIRYFYSQSFQPKMITQYFNGWDEVNNIFVNELIEEDIFINDFGNLCVGEWDFPLPKTLSQFITNCIQAGIKLEWRG